MIATFKTVGMKLIAVNDRARRHHVIGARRFNRMTKVETTEVVGGPLPNETQKSGPAEPVVSPSGGGIGNWNRLALTRMSRNPNTRRNSSRT